MKKALLFALVSAAGTALAAVAAGSIKRQGGVGPTVDKLKQSKFAKGASAIAAKVLQHPAYAATVGKIVPGNTNDNFVGEHVESEAKAA